MDQHTLERLEFGKVLERIAAGAMLAMGAAAVRALAPTGDLNVIRTRSDRTGEGAAVLQHGEDFAVERFEDPQNLLDRAAIEDSALAPTELQTVAAILRNARDLQKVFKRLRETAPTLDETLDGPGPGTRHPGGHREGDPARRTGVRRCQPRTPPGPPQHPRPAGPHPPQTGGPGPERRPEAVPDRRLHDDAERPLRPAGPGDAGGPGPRHHPRPQRHRAHPVRRAAVPRGRRQRAAGHGVGRGTGGPADPAGTDGPRPRAPVRPAADGRGPDRVRSSCAPAPLRPRPPHGPGGVLRGRLDPDRGRAAPAAGGLAGGQGRQGRAPEFRDRRHAADASPSPGPTPAARPSA